MTSIRTAPRRCIAFVVGVALVACSGPAHRRDKEAATPATPAGPSDAEGVAQSLAQIELANRQLSAGDRTIKFCAMAESPLRFLRGSNHLYWAAYAGDARLARFGNPRTRTWLQGDAHPFNMGAFDNDDGSVVYSLNDFDEAIVADYQYDLWRMAASIVLVARGGDLSPADAAGLVDEFATSYRDAIASYRGNRLEDRTRFTTGHLPEPARSFVVQVKNNKGRQKALARWTRLVGEKRLLNVDLPELAAPGAQRRQEIESAVAGYGRTLSGGIQFDSAVFAVKSIARRLRAGTGSLGTPRFYVLIEGATLSPHDDRILDVKRQQPPTAYRYLSAPEKKQYDGQFLNEAHRHARGCKALLKDTDDFLGWMSLSDGDYSVRERSVYKKTLPLHRLVRPGDYRAMARLWGRILATTHARGDKDFDAGVVPHSVDGAIDRAISGHDEEFRRLVRTIAVEFADRTERDWAGFVGTLTPGACAAPAPH